MLYKCHKPLTTEILELGELMSKFFLVCFTEERNKPYCGALCSTETSITLYCEIEGCIEGCERKKSPREDTSTCYTEGCVCVCKRSVCVKEWWGKYPGTWYLQWPHNIVLSISETQKSPFPPSLDSLWPHSTGQS